MAQLDEGYGITTRSSPDIQNAGGCGRQVFFQGTHRERELHPVPPFESLPFPLAVSVVVIGDPVHVLCPEGLWLLESSLR